jgi:hypothetical protein
MLEIRSDNEIGIKLLLEDCALPQNCKVSLSETDPNHFLNLIRKLQTLTEQRDPLRHAIITPSEEYTTL